MKNDALGEGLLQQGAFVLGEGLLQEEPFVLDVGYTTEVSCMSFGKGCEGLAEDSIETLVDFSSNECEIDISPFPGERDELLLQNKELACRMEELGVENETLRCKIRELEEEVSKLRSQTGNTPLPTLYVQLNTLRKEIAELEKRNQDLETENAELNIRLDKKGTETVCSEAESKPVRDSVRIPKPFKPTSFSRSASEPVDSVLTPKLKKQCSMRSESFEAAKLDFAEKLVKKEEMIQKLRKERDDCVNQVNELSAGIDGLETRFDLQLSTYQTEVMQKFENLIKSFKSIREREEEVDRTVGWFQNELSRMQKTFPDEIQRLSQSCQTLREEKDQEKEELEELLQHRTRNLEEAKKQIVSLSDEIKHQTEFVNELENTIDGLESKIASMKTQRLVSDGMHTVTSFKETDNLRERVVQLEEELAELRMTNETLLKEKDEAQEALFSPTQAKEAKGIEDLNKENEELRNELLEVSEKLVAMEEQNDSLKEEIENQSDFFGQCLNLEEELEAQRRMNRGLEEQLNRRKKRIASLQAELGHLKQQLVDMESGFGSRKRSKETVSNTFCIKRHSFRKRRFLRMYPRYCNTKDDTRSSKRFSMAFRTNGRFWLSRTSNRMIL